MLAQLQIQFDTITYGFTDSQLTDTWLQLVSMSYTDSMHVSFLVGHAPW